ncbi:MAG: LytR/AlgR family response regulator transcription factor [Anaerovoracaceae bacterium]|jgi:DNA-binding LytR/AlgR family response regulator
MDNMDKLNDEASHFVIITRNSTEKLKADDILYFESEGRKVHVHTKERVISFNGSMEQVKKKLDRRFCSCHASYAVNLTKVVRLAGYTVEMEGGAILPISQRKHAETRYRYHTYLRENFPCNLEDDIV